MTEIDPGPRDEPQRFALLSTVALQAAAVDVTLPTKQHPNKMPFSGILTYLNEPSDAAPEGTGGRRILVTAEAAKNALDSLIGMCVDCQPTFAGHAPQNKIGMISGAEIKSFGDREAIVVDGYIFAADFPELAKEIKANKSALGMSFEARDLWTHDPKANPVSIVECVFTGAAILLKDKAAYKTTSISAAANTANPTTMSMEDFQMAFDDTAKAELAEIVAAAMKPVADAVAAQAKEIEELKKLPENIQKVQAANVLDKVEPHAKRLNDAADKMEEAGIGLEASAGHVHVLRKMADGMRADAANGKMPHVFDRFYAAADKAATGAVKADEAAVAAVKAESEKQIAEVKAAAEKAEAAHKDAVAALETQVKTLTAKLEGAKAAEGRPERQTIAFALNASQEAAMEKAGLTLPTDGSKIPADKLNAALAAAGIDNTARFQLKTVLAHMGAID